MLREARADDRKARQTVDAEADLQRRLAELEAALREAGQDGVHGRRHIRPLDEIQEDAQRFLVLKARVERLEALWSINRRKREARAKFIIGGALIDELIDVVSVEDTSLLARVLDVLNRRVETPRDRHLVKQLLGAAPLLVRHGGDGMEPFDSALAGAFAEAPDFDTLVVSAMAEEAQLRPGDIDADYADVEASWRPQA